MPESGVVSTGNADEPAMLYEYKCVAGPTVVSVRKSKEREQGVKAFEDIMNREAADGWEFVAVDEFHTSEPESWLSRKRVYVSSKMLVFRRPKQMATPVVKLEPPMPAEKPARMEPPMEKAEPAPVEIPADRVTKTQAG